MPFCLLVLNSVRNADIKSWKRGNAVLLMMILEVGLSLLISCVEVGF